MQEDPILGPKKQKYNPINTKQLRIKERKKNPFIIRGIIPESGITIIAGGTGSGKSLLALHLLDCISTGRPLFDDFETKKLNCLLIDLEMTEDDILQRVQEVTDEDSNIDIMFERTWKIEDNDPMSWLENYVKDKNIKVVCFDTLSKIHKSASENDNAAMTSVMERLLEINRDLSVTIILIHHHNKSSEATGLGKGRGASAIPDNAASYLMVTSKKTVRSTGEQMLHMEISQEKSRRREGFGKISCTIIHNKETRKTNFEYNGVVNEKESSDDQARELVLEYITGNPGVLKGEAEKRLMGFVSRQSIREAIIMLIEKKKIKVQRIGGAGQGLYIEEEGSSQEEADGSNQSSF